MNALKQFLSAACVMGALTVHAQVVIPASGIINTIAGTGASGYSGDGGAAPSATFLNPVGVAIDPTTGNIFIADSGNNLIRKIDISTGIITKYAGGGWFSNPSRQNGSGTYCGPLIVGDGGLAINAMLDQPTGLVFDPAGNLYFSNKSGHRVQKITPAGIISTIAGNGCPGRSGDGGAADSALLNMPMGVAVDPLGNVYIADYGNNYVRKYTPSTGIISKFAGTTALGYSGDGGPATAALFNQPTGVTVDSAGNVYIADSGNNRVREVLASSSNVQTVAGTGAAGYSGDGESATSAMLNTPMGVAFDSNGTLYIADTNGYRIRVVSSSVITTVAGNGIGGFLGDGGTATSAEIGKRGYTGVYGIALDSNDNLYLADGVNQRIRVVAH